MNNGHDFSGDKNPNYKTGYCIGSKRPGFYNTWHNMKSRCYSKSNPKYYRYGGRGISVCDEWLDIKVFSEWALNNGWKQGLTLDRIDNDGNYCPENCRWVSVSENSRKKSSTKIDNKIAEEIRSRRNENWYDLADEYGCTHGNIWFIMNNVTHVSDMECSKAIKRIKEKNKVKF